MGGQVAGTAATFAQHLAEVLVATRGFERRVEAEAEMLAGACDIVLTKSDGMSFVMVGLVDRERRPQARFTLTLEDVKAVGRRCLVHTGYLHNAKMPVYIHIIEISAEPWSEDDRRRLAGMKAAGMLSKVVIAATQADLSSGTARVNRLLWRDPSPRYLRKLMRGRHAAAVPVQP